jgi:hypothetical protein
VWSMLQFALSKCGPSGSFCAGFRCLCVGEKDEVSGEP